MNRISPPSEAVEILSKVTVEGKIVRFILNRDFVSSGKSKYSRLPFFEDQWIRFPDIAEDALKKVPTSILLVPFILNIAPVIWKLGIKARIGNVDPVLANSVSELHDKFREIWHEEKWDGELFCEPATVPDSAVDILCNRSAISLYSGGIDSLSTVLSTRHQHDSYSLLTILGTDILTAENGESFGFETISAFANSVNAESARVMTNIGRFINTRLLEQSFKHAVNCWWTIQHGIGQSSMLAIPMWLSKIPLGYIAASNSVSDISRIGSRPDIDNLVRWSCGRIFHEGVELTRQQKIQQLIDEKCLHPEICFSIHVCTKPLAYDATVFNCECCEKCLRTIVGLLLAGADWQMLAGFGFPKTYSDRILRKNLIDVFEEDRNLDFVGKIAFWTEFQAILCKDKRLIGLIPLSAQWIDQFDFVKCEEKFTRIRQKHLMQNKVKHFLRKLFLQ